MKTMQPDAKEQSTTSAPPPSRQRQARTPFVMLMALILFGALVTATGYAFVPPSIAAPPLSVVAPATEPPLSSAATSGADLTNLQSAVISTSQGVGPAVVSIRTDQGLGSGVIYD